MVEAGDGSPPLAPHDLWRRIGRIAYQAGVPWFQVKGIPPHGDLAETNYHNGVDLTEQRAGMDLFAKAFRVPGSETHVPEPAARPLPGAPARS